MLAKELADLRAHAYTMKKLGGFTIRHSSIEVGYDPVFYTFLHCHIKSVTPNVQQPSLFRRSGLEPHQCHDCRLHRSSHVRLSYRELGNAARGTSSASFSIA